MRKAVLLAVVGVVAFTRGCATPGVVKEKKQARKEYIETRVRREQRRTLSPEVFQQQRRQKVIYGDRAAIRYGGGVEVKQNPYGLPPRKEVGSWRFTP